MTEKTVNYKALFLAGIALMGAGVTMGAAIETVVGIPLMGAGIMMIIIGVKNRDKWAN